MTVRPARHGFHPHKAGLPQAAVGSRRHRQLMDVANPLRQQRLRSPWGWMRLRRYETVSPRFECDVECLEVATGFGLKVGWAFVYHRDDGQQRWSEIQELFVLPQYRRQGVASLLEEVACNGARARASREMRLLMHTPDANGPVRAAPRRFGAAVGYQWRWPRAAACPPVAAVGYKSL